MYLDEICANIELNYELIEVSKVRRLKQIAERLNVSPSGLAGIITQHGGKLEKNSNPILEEEHLKLIASEYVKGVQYLFKEAKQAIEEGYSYRVSKEYFRQFVKPSSFLHVVDFTNWSLSEELIEEAFYKLIDSPSIRLDKGSWAFNKIMHRMLRIVFNYCIDLKSLIKSILSPQLFFTYASEENNSKVANFRVASLLA